MMGGLVLSHYSTDSFLPFLAISYEISIVEKYMGFRVSSTTVVRFSRPSGFHTEMNASLEPSSSAEGMSAHWNRKHRIVLAVNRLGGGTAQPD